MPSPSRTSRYRFSLLMTDQGGRAFLTEAQRFAYQKLPDNRTHTVVEGDDLFRLAGAYFPSIPNGQDLWWAIGHFQADEHGEPRPLHDPTLALVPGTIIIIPSERTIIEQVLSDRRRPLPAT